MDGYLSNHLSINLLAPGAGEALRECIQHTTELIRICLVPFLMNNRILGPYLAAIHRIRISVMSSNDWKTVCGAM
jgi:hypothetical protein